MMKHYDVKYDVNGNLPEYLIYKKKSTLIIHMQYNDIIWVSIYGEKLDLSPSCCKNTTSDNLSPSRLPLHKEYSERRLLQNAHS